jgi:1-deoxy-D-xylulose-5-phosphate reductoisomerase
MPFTDIVPTIEQVLGSHDVPSRQELTVSDVLAADAWARRAATAAVGQ